MRSLSSSMFVRIAIWCNWTKSQCSSSSTLDHAQWSARARPRIDNRRACGLHGPSRRRRFGGEFLVCHDCLFLVIFVFWRLENMTVVVHDVEEDMDGDECGECREREERYTHCLKLIIRLYFVYRRRITLISICLSLQRSKVGVPPQTLTQE